MTEAALILKVDSTEVNQGAKSLDDLAAAGGKAERSTNALASATAVLANVAKAAAGAFGLMKIAQYAQEATMLAARYETMGIVMKVAGNNAGYTAAQMNTYSTALQKNGISMLQSRDALTQLATAQIDLSKATAIGRAAQDLAVVANTNSSEAMARMIHGIKSGQIEVLRTLGLNMNFEASYKSMAVQLGINEKSLTEQQKTLARTNAVLNESKNYTGIYEESMTTAGKAMSSLARYSENLQIKLGNVFLPSLAAAVFGYTDALKGANREADKLAQDGKIEKWASNVTTAIVALTTATAVYAGVLVAQVVAGAASAAASFIALNVAHVQALAMNIALAKAEQARIATMIESTAAQVPAIVSELRYVMAMESVAATTETANAMAAQRIALQGRLAAIEEANVIAESQLAAATARTAEAQTLASASGSIWTKVLFGTSVAANLASGALSKLSLALNVLMAAWVGWEIGTWLATFEEVRVVGQLMIGQFMLGFEHVKFGAQVAGAAIAAMTPNGEAFATAYARIAASHDKEVAKIKEQTQAFAEMETTAKGASAYDEQAAIKRAEAAKVAAAAADKAAAATDAAKKASDEHQKAITSMIASLQKESDTYGMTAAQVKIYEAAKLGMTKTQLEHTIALIEGNAAMDEARKAAEDAAKAQEQHLDTQRAAVNATFDGNEALRVEIASIGKTREELGLMELARLDETIAKKQATTATGDALVLLNEEIRLLQERRGLLVDKGAAVESAKQVADETKARVDMWKKVDDVARDTFVNIWGHGKSTLDRLKDTLKNGLLAMLYEMGKKQLLINVGVVGGGTAASGAANASTGSDGGGLGSLPWMTNFGGSASTSVAVAGSKIFEMGGETAGAWMINNANTIGTAMDVAGTAMGYVNAVMALRDGQWGNAVGSAVGTWFGGPIGGAIGSTVGGFVDKVFGWGNKGTPTVSTGNAAMQFDAAGQRTGMQTYYGGSSAGVDTMINNMQTSYMKAAMALGIGTVATSFSYGGNTGKNGQSPNFALGGGSFYQAETTSSDAAIQLAASRAVFSALQGSDLPAYLANMFDGLTASSMSQQQITDTLAFAGSVKQMRDALLETRTPLEVMRAQVADGTAAFATSAATFRNDFVAAIDAGINPTTFAQWQQLGTAIDQLAATDAQAAADNLKTLMDAAKAAMDAAKAAGAAARQAVTDSLATAKQAVGGAFSVLTAAVDRERQSITTAYNDSVTTVGKRIDEIKTSIGDLSNLASTLRSTVSSMGVGMSRISAQGLIASALSFGAAGGALADTQQLRDALTIVSKPSEGLFTNFIDYQRDFIRTSNDIQALGSVADVQLSAAEQQVLLLEDSVRIADAGYADQMTRLDLVVTIAQSQIDAINGTTLAVQDVFSAVNALSVALGAQGVAASAVAAITPTVAATPSYTNADIAAYVGANIANPMDIYLAAAQNGVSLARIDAAMGWSAGTSSGWAASQGLPSFATGVNAGILSNDTLLQAHGGERITPAQYVDVERGARDETNALLRRLIASNDETKAELTRARNELELIKGTNKRIADITEKSDAIGPAPARTAL